MIKLIKKRKSIEEIEKELLAYDVEKEIRQNPKAGVLNAYYCDHGLYAWCDYCLKFHIHGVVQGHRVAHCCYDNSPYRLPGAGYILKYCGLLTMDIKKTHKEKRSKYCRKHNKFYAPSLSCCYLCK